MSDQSKAVFLSYASQDAAAARRICEALRSSGVEVWFDQSELVGGDAWDVKIREQIKSCTLFLPLISASTNARREGYFRREWKLAVDRTHDMDEALPFLVPIVIDDTTDAGAFVPEKFRAVQWTRLPGGEATPAFCARVKKRLEGETDRAGQRPEAGHPGTQNPNPGTANRRLGRLWWSLPIVGTALVTVLVWKEKRPAAVPAAGMTSPATTPQNSAARQLADRAAAIVDSPGDKSSTNLGAAAALCAQATALDPSDAEIWAIAARVHAEIFRLRFDASDEQRQRVQQAVGKAISLAPGSPAARRAQAVVFATVVATPESCAEAEKIYRGLLRETPGDTQLSRELAYTLPPERATESISLLEHAGSLVEAGWVCFGTGRFAEADKFADRMLAQERSAGALYLKAHVQLYGIEDPEATQRTVDLLPLSEMETENGASIALFVAYCRRDPERILRAVSAFPQNFLTKQGFAGPKKLWSGAAQMLAGHREAAEAEWTIALQQTMDRQKDRPGDLDLMVVQALLQAELGQSAAAEKTYRVYRDLAPPGASGSTAFSGAWVLLRLGRSEEVLAGLDRRLRDGHPGWEITHACVRFCPAFDPLRGDPRFDQLLRDTLPKGAKPFEGPALALSPPQPVPVTK